MEMSGQLIPKKRLLLRTETEGLGHLKAGLVAVIKQIALPYGLSNPGRATRDQSL
jgi:hypothetical protein